MWCITHYASIKLQKGIVPNHRYYSTLLILLNQWLLYSLRLHTWQVVPPVTHLPSTRCPKSVTRPFFNCFQPLPLSASHLYCSYFYMYVCVYSIHCCMFDKCTSVFGLTKYDAFIGLCSLMPLSYHTGLAKRMATDKNMLVHHYLDIKRRRVWNGYAKW